MIYLFFNSNLLNGWMILNNIINIKIKGSKRGFSEDILYSPKSLSVNSS